MEQFNKDLKVNYLSDFVFGSVILNTHCKDLQWVVVGQLAEQSLQVAIVKNTRLLSAIYYK